MSSRLPSLLRRAEGVKTFLPFSPKLVGVHFPISFTVGAEGQGWLF